MIRTNRPYVEPEVLLFLRFTNGLLALWFVGERLRRVVDGNTYANASSGTNALIAVIVLVYLYSGWLARRLGTRYLPIGLILMSFGAITVQWITVGYRLTQGVLPGFLYDRALFLPLLIPVLIIPAVYNLRVLLVYLLGTSSYELLLAVILDLFIPTAPLHQIYSPVYDGNILHFYGLFDTVLSDVIIRLGLYSALGIFFGRLMFRPYVRFRSLVAKNAALTQYATTIERLAVSQERNRLARELHDTLAHTLTAVSVQIEALNKQLDYDPNSVKGTLNHIRELTRNGLKESRRALNALRASPLEDMGLKLAMQQLIKAMSERSGLHITLELPEQLDDLQPEIEQSIYRITEEALNNANKHARASNVTVKLKRTDDHLHLTIHDNGVGFNPYAASTDGHYGLMGMQERAMLCNGRLSINGKSGTTVQLTIEE